MSYGILSLLLVSLASVAHACSPPSHSKCEEGVRVTRVYSVAIPGIDVDPGYRTIESVHAIDGRVVLVETNTRHGPLIAFFDVADGKLSWTTRVYDHLLVSEKPKYKRNIVAGWRDTSSDRVVLLVPTSYGLRELKCDLDKKTIMRGQKIEPFYIEDPPGGSSRIRVSEGRLLLPRGDYEAQFDLFDLSTNTRHALPNHENTGHPPTSCTISKSGAHGAATDGSAWLYRLDGAKSVQRCVPSLDVLKEWRKSGGYAPNVCAISDDDKRLAIGTRGGNVLVFDIGSGNLECLRNLGEPPMKPPEDVLDLCFMKNSRFLIVSDPIRILDCEQSAWVDVPVFAQVAARTSMVTDVCGASLYAAEYSGDRLERYDIQIGAE